jgi:hypothetical protein
MSQNQPIMQENDQIDNNLRIKFDEVYHNMYNLDRFTNDTNDADIDDIYESFNRFKECYEELLDGQDQLQEEFNELANDINDKVKTIKTNFDYADPQDTHIYTFGLDNDLYIITLLMINDDKTTIKIDYRNQTFVSRIQHKVTYSDSYSGNMILTETINDLIKLNFDEGNLMLEYLNNHIKITMSNNITGADLTFRYIICCMKE